MKKSLIISAIMFAPIFAFAQSSSADDLLNYILSLLKYILGMVGVASMFFFFLNLIKFLKANAEGKADLGKSKDMMIWSAIALFMMFGIWTVVAYVQSSLGIENWDSGIKRTPTMTVEI